MTSPPPLFTQQRHAPLAHFHRPLRLQSDQEKANFQLAASQDDNDDLLNDLKEKSEGYESEIASLQSLVQSSNEEISEGREKLSKLEDELAGVSSDLDEALKMSEFYKGEAEKGKVDEEQMQLNEALREEIESLKESRASDIQAVRDEASSEKRKIALEFEGATSKLRLELKSIEDELSEREVDLKDGKDEINELRRKLEKADVESYESKNKIEDLQEQVSFYYF